MSFADAYNLLKKRNRVLRVRLTILDNQFHILDMLEGLCSGGSYNYNTETAVRRTCDISMVLKNRLLPKDASSPFWLNKRFNVEIGVDGAGVTEWFNLGVYAILNVNVSHTLSDSKLDISGGDLACELNGDISGELLTNYLIEIGGNIGEAIRTIMVDVLGYKNVLIEATPYTVPYEIEKDMGDTYWDIIEELTELYRNYESFFDVNGRFVFKKKSTLYYDEVLWDSREDELMISISRQLNYSNIKNKFKMYGYLNDNTGEQIEYELEVRDANYPNNPFTIEKLAELNPRTMYYSDDKYATVEQCKEYVEYLVQQHTNFADTASVVLLPLYYLDVNKLVYLYDSKSETDGKYAIKGLSCGLGVGDTMTLDCYRVYDPV